MRLKDLLRAKGIISPDKAAPSAGPDHTRIRNLSATAALTRNGETMKLIPWEDIWTSLRVARIRGNGDMIEVFYDTLFKEAIFDDDGAWSVNSKNRE
jgi:hypothetical protein